MFSKQVGLIGLALCGALGCGATPEGEFDSSEAEVGEATEALLPKNSVVAVFDAANATWVFDTNASGAYESGADFVSSVGAFGGAGDIALSGYNDGLVRCGQGAGDLAIYRPSTNEFFIDKNHDGLWQTGTDYRVSNFLPPETGFIDTPILWSFKVPYNVNIAAIWPACRTVLGVVRRSASGKGSLQWIIDSNNNKKADIGDWHIWYGRASDIPVPLGTPFGFGSELAVWEPDTQIWHVDSSGNRGYSPCDVDTCTQFGSPGDTPFANPNLHIRATSHGTSRFFDTNQNGVWDAKDTTSVFGGPTTQPIIWGPQFD